MATGRHLQLATVTAVKDTTVCYPCCSECYSKLSLDTTDQSFWCSRCHSSYDVKQVTYRYRLSLVIAESSHLAHVTVFGGTLQPFFGTSATSFNRFMQSLEGQHSEIYADVSVILSKALDLTFVGRQFWFGINNREVASCSQNHRLPNHNSQHVPAQTNFDGFSKAITLVATQMIRVGDGHLCTVVNSVTSLFRPVPNCSSENLSEAECVNESHDFKKLGPSNISAFISSSHNPVSLTSFSDQTCLLSCDRELVEGQQSKQDHCSHMSSFLQNSRGDLSREIGPYSAKLSFNESCPIIGTLENHFTPETDIQDDAKREKLVLSGLNTLPSCECETLPPCGDETLPPCGDETLPPWGETCPACGGATLPQCGCHFKKLPSGDAFYPWFDDKACGFGGAIHSTNNQPGAKHFENRTLLQLDRGSQCYPYKETIPEKSVAGSQTEIFQDKSDKPSQNNDSLTFDDSSLFLECDKLEVTQLASPRKVTQSESIHYTQQHSDHCIDFKDTSTLDKSINPDLHIGKLVQNEPSDSSVVFDGSGSGSCSNESMTNFSDAELSLELFDSFQSATSKHKLDTSVADIRSVPCSQVCDTSQDEIKGSQNIPVPKIRTPVVSSDLVNKCVDPCDKTIPEKSVANSQTELDIEIFRDRSDIPSQNNDSLTFDYSSFFLECDKLEVTHLASLRKVPESESIHYSQNIDNFIDAELHSCLQTQCNVNIKVPQKQLISNISELSETCSHLHMKNKTAPETITLSEQVLSCGMVTSKAGPITDKVGVIHHDKTSIYNHNLHLSRETVLRCPEDAIGPQDRLWQNWSNCDNEIFITNQNKDDIVKLASTIGKHDTVIAIEHVEDVNRFKGTRGKSAVSSTYEKLDGILQDESSKHVRNLRNNLSFTKESEKIHYNNDTSLLTGRTDNQNLLHKPLEQLHTLPVPLLPKVIKQCHSTETSPGRNCTNIHVDNQTFKEGACGTGNNVADYLWEDVPESEDLEAFLGDFSISPQTNYVKEQNGEKTRKILNQVKNNTLTDLKFSKFLKSHNSINGGKIPQKCLKHTGKSAGRKEKKKSVTRSEIFVDFADSLDFSDLGKLVQNEPSDSSVVFDGSGSGSCSIESMTNLSDAELSLELFDSFQSATSKHKLDTSVADIRSVPCSQVADTSQDEIKESQNIPVPKIRTPVVFSDLVNEYVVEKERSVKFSRRLSAVSNVHLIDIRMRIATKPSDRCVRTPRSCLKTKTTSIPGKQCPVPDQSPIAQPDGNVLPYSEDLFTPSPVVAKRLEFPLKLQQSVGHSEKKENETPIFSQSTPLLFSQCPDSERKSVKQSSRKPLCNLPDANVSVDLFDSPDLFSDTNGTHGYNTSYGQSFGVHSSRLKQTLERCIANTVSNNIKREVIGGQGFPGITNIERTSLGVSVNSSSYSTDLFSPDVFGSSLPPNESTTSLKKNLFF